MYHMLTDEQMHCVPLFIFFFFKSIFVVHVSWSNLSLYLQQNQTKYVDNTNAATLSSHYKNQAVTVPFILCL